MNKAKARQEKLRKQDAKAAAAAVPYANYVTRAQFLSDLKWGYKVYAGLILGGVAALEFWPAVVGPRVLPKLNQAFEALSGTYWILAAVVLLLLTTLLMLVFPRRLRFLLKPAEASLSLLTKAMLPITQALALCASIAMAVLIQDVLQNGSEAHWTLLWGYLVAALIAPLYVAGMEFHVANQYIEKYAAGRVLPQSDRP